MPMRHSTDGGSTRGAAAFFFESTAQHDACCARANRCIARDRAFAGVGSSGAAAAARRSGSRARVGGSLASGGGGCCRGSRRYERNKHIFPASRWEVYDPHVKRDRYTIHGDEVEKDERKL